MTANIDPGRAIFHNRASLALAHLAVHRINGLRITSGIIYAMDALALSGLVAVTAMLIFYALEDHSPWFVLAFAGACLLASAYGFLQGAWPFGIVEAIWAVVAARRWRTRVLTARAT